MLTINNTLDGYLKDVEIKGNTIQDTSNLADIRSVGDKVEGQELYEIPVLSRGKNLFDGELEQGAIHEVTGENSNGNSSLIRSKNFIKIPKLKKIRFSKNGVACAVNMFIYNSNKKFIRKASDSFILNEDETYVRFYLGGTVDDSIQLEEGTVATPYEPYQEDKLTILSPVQLEKVGDVRDRIIEKDGVWGVEKNIENKNFDGSENWREFNVNSDSVNKVTLEINDNVNDTNVVMCDKFKYLPSNEDEEHIRLANAKEHIRVFFNKDKASSLTEWKSWLNINPIHVKYATNSPQFIPLPHDQQIKLRTFASKTNISFLTEIEGTIKAQVPKSLGATVNTHTEQISNLNKELDRVKKLEESTVSTVETESDFTTVEATSNGYFEDVKLEGKTLTTVFTCSTNRHYGKWVEVDCVNYKTVELGKVYTIIGNLNNTAQCGLKNKSNEYLFPIYSSVNYICEKITFSKSEDLTIVTDYEGLVNMKLIILEGDHTQNPPSYFEGLKSVGDGVDEIVVSSVNKYSDISTKSPDIDNVKIQNQLQIPITESFSIVNPYHNKVNVVVFKDGSWLKDIEIGFGCNYIKLLEGEIVTYLNQYFRNGWGSNDAKKIKNILISTHQDKKRLLYYNNETQAWEKPILRQWDSIEKHADGKYYYHQRSGEVVLNGSETTWGVYSVDGTNKTSFGKLLLGAKPFENNHVSTVICDKFRTDSTKNVYGCLVSGVAINKNNWIYFSLDSTIANSSETFNQWLQANNVTVVYQLAQEKVYECTNIDLITYANETNYVVESGAISPKTTLKVHNNISNVVNLLQKKVSLLESNITSYMITQNRLMLASRYNADNVTFKVDYSVCNEYRLQENYDADLYNLILNNIIVGKDNYDYDHMLNIIMDYASWSQISWDQFDILVGMMDLQHNPPIELPTEGFPEETPEE